MAGLELLRKDLPLQQPRWSEQLNPRSHSFLPLLMSSKHTNTKTHKKTQQQSEEPTVSPFQSLNNNPGDLSETCCTIAPLLSLLLTIVIAYLLSTVIMNLQSFIGKPSKKNMSILRSGCVKLMQKTLLFLTALSIASNATWCNLSNIQNAKPNILYLASPVSR